MFEWLSGWLQSLHPAIAGLFGGVIIASLNMVGALLILVFRNPTEKTLDSALGFGAGIMTSAAFTSLIIPGIEYASHESYTPVSIFGVKLLGVIPVLIGFLAAVVVFNKGGRFITKAGESISSGVTADGGTVIDGEDAVKKWFGVDDSVPNRRVYGLLFFIAAITLHNMPEGMAVGVAYGSGNIGNALTLTLAIGLQNIPEGFAVSIAALNAGLHRRWYAAVTGIRAGLVEVPITVLGAWVVVVISPLLPYAMGFAGAGMLYVIVIEILPQAHERGFEQETTTWFMVGAALMLTLDVAIA